MFWKIVPRASRQVHPMPIYKIEERKKDKLEFFWIDVNNFKDYIFLPQNLLNHLQNNIDEFEYILNDERIKSRKIKE